MAQFHRDSFIEAKNVPWIATGLAFCALCVAWLAQYGGGLAPCELCYLQRYGYWAAIVVGLVATFFSRKPKSRKLWLNVLGLVFLVVAGTAIFHVGVEQGWWHGSAACVGTASAGQSLEDLAAAINAAPVTRCDEAAFQMFGISMAGYDALYAVALALFAFWGASRRGYR
jgi:disulfide bond formation protein DsbB